MKRLRSLMVLGTASNVGKSLVTAALCRIFNDRGLSVAPFKAQNMSLESAATPDGDEIGRAQALQAEAARTAAHRDMNPILIKPASDRRAQVVVEGRIWADVDAWDYHRRRTAELFPRVVAAYERLAATRDLIVLEGAGSPAEINLRAGDIVNMRMAAAADAACILVVDIDRGGAFAALAGTLLLLEPEERARIHGFIINKFRGDVALLEPGIDAIVERIGLPCLGVIPWFVHGLEEEDGYGRAARTAPWPDDRGPDRALRIAVVAYPFASNMSDIDALIAEPSMAVRHVATPAALAGADLVILPGSKETVSDLRWLGQTGMADALHAHVGGGGAVFGICGGLQMLGERIDDPAGIEGGGNATGLGLLALTTTMATTKTTVPVHARIVAQNWFGGGATSAYVHGYEIHVGQSTIDTPAALVELQRAGSHETVRDGAVSGDGAIAGTYVHGLLDDDALRHAILDALRARSGLAPARTRNGYRAEREPRIDNWAAHVAAALDIERIAALTQR